MKTPFDERVDALRREFESTQRVRRVTHAIDPDAEPGELTAQAIALWQKLDKEEYRRKCYIEWKTRFKEKTRRRAH